MRILSRTLLFLLVPLLAACASSQPMARSAAPADARPNLMHDDAEYVSRVNAEARRRGLLVQWVNPPPRYTARRTE